MKKEIVLCVLISSVSMMNGAMSNNDRDPRDNKVTQQVPLCCPRSFAVPPCKRCQQSRLEKISFDKSPTHIPQPLSVSQEMERQRRPR